MHEASVQRNTLEDQAKNEINEVKTQLIASEKNCADLEQRGMTHQKEDIGLTQIMKKLNEIQRGDRLKEAKEDPKEKDESNEPELLCRGCDTPQDDEAEEDQSQFVKAMATKDVKEAVAQRRAGIVGEDWLN